jgi:hypothetical protein
MPGLGPFLLLPGLILVLDKNGSFKYAKCQAMIVYNALYVFVILTHLACTLYIIRNVTLQYDITDLVDCHVVTWDMSLAR